MIDYFTCIKKAIFFQAGNHPVIGIQLIQFFPEPVEKEFSFIRMLSLGIGLPGQVDVGKQDEVVSVFPDFKINPFGATTEFVFCPDLANDEFRIAE